MSQFLRKLVALLSVLMVLAAMLPAGIHKAEAATGALTEMEAVQLLQYYSIVRGSPGGQLDLDQPITRAQAATVFVRTMGFEELAQTLKSSVPFTDSVGHWAAGEIAMAERLGLMRGDGNGTFRPESQITYAELLTVLLRIVKQEPTGAWNPTVIYSTADALGFAPRGVLPTSPAVRGKIFWSLASAISQVPLPTGETVLQKYLDQTPPTLTLDRSQVTNADATVTISGTTRDAFKVLVEGKPATLDTFTGKFTYTATLAAGSNSFTVKAVDYAGNEATAEFTAERKAPIASIEITGSNVVKMGGSTKLTVVAKDSRGNEVPLDGVDVSLTGDVAKFDLRTTTLTALNKTGRGVLTLSAGNVRKSFTFDVTSLSDKAARLIFSSVNDGRAPALNKDATVKVQVVDDTGRLVTDDYFRNVRLTATGLTGVTISPTTAATQAGVATFTISGRTQGIATLVATSTDLEEATTDVQFLTSPRIVLTATPATLKPDGNAATRIQAYLQDDEGKPVVNNTASDIRVTLSAKDGDGYLTDPYITIRRSTSNSSGDDAYYKAGVLAGKTTISGDITSGQTYAVQTLPITLSGTPEPIKLAVKQSTGYMTPNSTPTDVTIQVLDSRGSVVTWGSFAFKLKVTTSNRETVTNGLPDGVTLTYPDQDYGPVQDSTTTSGTVVGRTYMGTAKVKLAYNKSGVVTITPVLVGAVDAAYNPTLGLGPASSTQDLTAAEADFTFSGTPYAIELTADSAGLGKDKPAGAVSTAATMTVRARVVDRYGGLVPAYTGSITLTRTDAGDQVTRLSGTSTDSITRRASQGVAEFTVQATSTAGFDVYSATATSLPAANITMAVRREKPDMPQVVAIRGATENAESPNVGYVAPTDDYMDIQLAQAYPSAEPTYWVNVKVVRKGSTTAVATDLSVDLKASPPIVRVPKSSLPSGQQTYQVLVNDGYGWSDPSPDDGFSTVVNAVYSTAFKMNATAYYDAATTKLFISTSGTASTGVLSKDLLTIVGEHDELNLGNVAVTELSKTSSSIVLQLNVLGDQLDPDTYSGTVKLEAKDGWYKSADGNQWAKGSEATVIKPMGVITGATLNRGTRQLKLQGNGLKSGSLNLSLVKIGTVALRPGSTSSYDQVTATTDDEITLTLSLATFNAIDELPSDAGVSASPGWLYVNYSGSTYQAAGFTEDGRSLTIEVKASSGSYNSDTNTLTISGKGFDGTTIDPTKLSFRRTTTGSPVYRLVGPTTVTIESDTKFTLQLSDADAAYFESTSGFANRNVYMNSDDGWLQDASGRNAAKLPTNQVMFKPVP